MEAGRNSGAAITIQDSDLQLTQRLHLPSAGRNFVCRWTRSACQSLYFANLQQHAVPLREADLADFAHSALALDVYPD